MPLPANLNERLGPLPIYAWGIVAGGSILGIQYARKRLGSSSSAPSSPTLGSVSSSAAPAASPSVPAQSSALGSFLAGGSYVPGDASGATGAPSTVVAGPPALTDNDQWLRAATTLVASSNGNLSMIQIDEALKAYLDGRPVTEQQAAIVELALRTSAGSPPYSVPAITIIPQNTPTPVLTPPPAPAPPPAAVPAWQPPPWLGGARFVKGSGTAIYLIEPGLGIEWIPSEDAFRAAGGSFNPPNYVTIDDSVLHSFPRVGVRPQPQFDPSL